VLHAELQAPVGDIALDVALDVEGGECLALAGPSGAGKTTIVRMIAGTSTPARGRITYADEVWLDRARGISSPPEQRRCGYVPQDHALFPHLSVWRNVAYGLRSRRSRAERRARALELLERFGLADRAEARPATLSGGERQRVALARALAIAPRLLLLDEPLAALDIRTRAAATRELGSVLSASGVPAILITHDFHDAAALADRVAIIDRGRVVQRDSAERLAAAPASAFVAEFTGSVVLTGHAYSGRGPLTVIELDGGGTATATDPGEGPVAVSVFPWEITLAPAAAAARDSAQNRLRTRVHSITAVGNRVRVGLDAGQPLVAEITQTAADELGLRVGATVTASWKATATRVTAR
jgi:molybdate transport system ATP-binding protein